ncbi:MAG: riboflavin synthase [Balneolaceae bacterium]
MFTGIVKEVGRVAEIHSMPGSLELIITAEMASTLSVDQSVSVRGVCLTVVSCDETRFRVQCVAETLRKTNLNDLSVGDPVNLEQAVSMDRALDGHIVQGHVDTTGEIVEIRKVDGTDRMIRVSFADTFRDLVVDRGSITLDGISLTIAGTGKGWLDVAIIPYTWEKTTLKHRSVGDRVNLEFDLFGKYVVAYLKRYHDTHLPDGN